MPSSAYSFSFTWNQSTLNKLRKNAMARLLKLGYKINNDAKSNAPYLTGALVNSIRVDASESDVVYILAGGNAFGKSVPYARRREYENKAHPNTRYYMRNAFQDGVRNFKEEFRNLI